MFEKVRDNERACMGVSENRGYLILGVLIIRILLFRVLCFRKLPYHYHWNWVWGVIVVTYRSCVGTAEEGPGSISHLVAG